MVETNTEAKAVEKVRLELAKEANRIWRLKRGRRREEREREREKRKRRKKKKKRRKQGSKETRRSQGREELRRARCELGGAAWGFVQIGALPICQKTLRDAYPPPLHSQEVTHF